MRWKLLGLLICAGLSSCGLLKKNEATGEAPEVRERYVGVITMVREQSGFVTIRMASGLPEVDGVLISRSLDGGQANLRLSGERVGDLLAADIRSGSPQKGDPVYLYKRLSKEEPSYTPMSRYAREQKAAE